MAEYDKKYFDFLDYVIAEHENGKTWPELCVIYKKEFNEYINDDTLRLRVTRYKKAKNRMMGQHYNEAEPVKKVEKYDAYVQYNSDGSVDAKKVVECNEYELQNPEILLKKLGYDTDRWELVTYRVSNWEGGANGEERHAVQYKVRPRAELSVHDMVNAAQMAFNCNIEPFHFSIQEPKDGLNNNRLMEIAPVELHMGKLAHDIETGENYDLKIAQKRFEKIFQDIYAKQQQEHCGKCILIIGSDFFNSESDNCTSVNKIPQQNDTRYIKLFLEGVKMYTKAILTLRTLFNKVDVMLCAGNHARAMETFLYIALQQRFVEDNVVNFIENYRQTQCYLFGNCAIFYNHGDANLKRTIKSIPAEFASEWGSHPFRELHLGHLHKETTVDDEGGMITRRIGSPCSTDAWHYSNRYVGAIKKHQIFIWDKDNGLINLYYIMP